RPPDGAIGGGGPAASRHARVVAQGVAGMKEPARGKEQARAGGEREGRMAPAGGFYSGGAAPGFSKIAATRAHCGQNPASVTGAAAPPLRHKTAAAIVGAAGWVGPAGRLTAARGKVAPAPRGGRRF